MFLPVFNNIKLGDLANFTIRYFPFLLFPSDVCQNIIMVLGKVAYVPSSAIKINGFVVHAYAHVIHSSITIFSIQQ